MSAHPPPLPPQHTPITETDALSQRHELSTLHAQLLEDLALSGLNRRLIWLYVTS